MGTLTSTDVKNLACDGVPFRSVTIVHGPNGIGKSNLLLLLHVLLSKKSVPPEIRDTVKFQVEGISEIPDFLRRGTRSADVNLVLECYSLAFGDLKKAFPKAKKHPKDRYPHQVHLRFGLSEYSGGVRVALKSVAIGPRMIYNSDEGSELTAAQMKALEDWINTEVAGSTVYIRADRIHRRDPVPLNLRHVDPAVDHLENAVLSLFTSKNGGADVIDNVRTTLRDFFKIQDIRSEILPADPSVGFEAGNYRVGIMLKEQSGQWFDLERMGTGIQQVLSIVCMIHVSRSKIALIEEFDTSLSPRKRSQLLEQLKQLVGEDKPLRQLIVTSHSTFEPKQDRVISIGAQRTRPGRTNFREWTKEDWARFRRTEQEYELGSDE